MTKQSMCMDHFADARNDEAYSHEDGVSWRKYESHKN